MTLEQARKILRLAPNEDPRAHFAEFQEARDHIASMIRTAPDPTMSGRYMKGLIEFDEALTVIKKHLGPDPDDDSRPIALGSKSEVVPPPPSKLPYFAWSAAVFVVAAIGLWFFLERSHRATGQEQELRIAALDREGSTLIESRRWQEAQEVFARIEKLSPGSEVVRQGRQRIETGMTEEQTQFIGYWTGQATAELEAGRLDEAEAAARQVLEKYPTEKDASQILNNVATARLTQNRTAALATVREALDQRQWEQAITGARKILAQAPGDPDATGILEKAQAGMSKALADQAKARELLKMAVARDQGQFDQQALDWLREARSLAPDNPEIAAQLEKQASYTRTLHVPGDFATPAEALAGARDRDRIVLAAGDWKGPLVINAAVELQGAGSATTRIQCPPGEGSALTLGPDAKGCHINGITFRHESFAVGSERFSVALIRGGSGTFSDCRFIEASGHGLAVIEGGHATASRCRFSGNGWNGAAVIGQGSTLEVRDSEALENFQNGIESWDGAAVILIKNRCEGNSRNGIHIDNGAASANAEGNQLLNNREFGLVIDSAAAGKITGNTATGNQLGGIVIRTAAAKVAVQSNQTILNKGPGLVLEKGLQTTAYATNPSSQNSGQQILADADLSGKTEVSSTPPSQPTAPTATPAALEPQLPAVETLPPRAIPVPDSAPPPRARIMQPE